MPVTEIILLGFFVASILNIISEKFYLKRLKFLSKPLLMPLLAFYYYFAADYFYVFVVVALFFGFLGDVFLLNAKKQLIFVAGMISFLIGHLFYINVFIQQIDFNQIELWIFAFIFVYVFLARLVYKKLSIADHPLKIPALTYMIVLLLMSYISFLRFFSVDGFDFWLPLIGSILFLLSDAIIAFVNFVIKKDKYGSLVMTTYISAQFLIVTGLI